MQLQYVFTIILVLLFILCGVLYFRLNKKAKESESNILKAEQEAQAMLENTKREAESLKKESILEAKKRFTD